AGRPARWIGTDGSLRRDRGAAITEVGGIYNGHAQAGGASMIERLPLDIFDDKSPEPAPEAREQPQEQAAARAHAEPPGGGSFDVSCQWCGEWFDNERETCPHCGGAHRKLTSPDEDTPELSCQWCLTMIEPGAERCPQCGARVVVPGQQIAGLNVPESELIPLE